MEWFWIVFVGVVAIDLAFVASRIGSSSDEPDRR